MTAAQLVVAALALWGAWDLAGRLLTWVERSSDLDDLDDHDRWLRDQWKATGHPPLDDPNITDDQLAEFGVLLAAAEARHVAQRVFGDVEEVGG